MADYESFHQDNVFDNILSLLRHLESEHDPDIHLYRGQLSRFTHDWLDENGPIKLESIYPSDYRFITNFRSHNEIPPNDITAARSYGRKVRDLFFSTLTLKASTGEAAWAWLKEDLDAFFERMRLLHQKINNGQSLEEIAKGSTEDISTLSTRLMRVFWSLAQHYFIATALTDVTFSPNVAAWFATQPWDADGALPTNGKGVIYRFNRPCLEQALKSQTERMTEFARARGDARPPDLFFIDIRDIPDTFAGRPNGQKGGSVYGFDQPELLRMIIQMGCLEVFEFYHSKKSEKLKSRRQIIVPDEDPFSKLAEKMKSAITLASKVDVTIFSPEGMLLDADATLVFSKLRLDAGLAINKARLGKVPIADEYIGFHVTEIESSGHHGYTELLAMAKYFDLGDLDSGVNLGMLMVGIGKYERGIKVLESASSLGSANAAFNLGALYTQRKDYENAETWFLRALKLGDKEANYNLGRIHEYRSNWEQAEHYYRLAHDVDEDHRAINNLGIALYQLGRREEARKYLELGANSGDEVAAYNLGALNWAEL